MVSRIIIKRDGTYTAETTIQDGTERSGPLSSLDEARKWCKKCEKVMNHNKVKKKRIPVFREMPPFGGYEAVEKVAIDPKTGAFVPGPDKVAEYVLSPPEATPPKPKHKIENSWLFKHMVEALKRDPGWTPQMYLVYNDLDDSKTGTELLEAYRAYKERRSA